MKNLFFSLVSCLFVLTSCFNSSKKQQDKRIIQIQKLDSLMIYCHNKRMFNGSIAIAKNDTVIYSKSFGPINNESNKEINSETIFYIASISKQFTAMGIMILQERKLLDYDDPIIKFLPNFNSINKNVTIRHLLQHTSGISDRTYYQLKILIIK